MERHKLERSKDLAGRAPRFAGRVIVVVGASSGMGAATGEIVAAEGGRVLAIARREELLRSTIQNWPGDCHHALALDACDAEAVREAMATLPEDFRTFHGAVFSVGAHLLRPLRSSKASDYNVMFQQHVVPAVNLMPALVRGAAGGASIVLVSSAARFRGGAGVGAYVAAKNAIVGLARAWANELAPRIRVNSVSPGVVRSAMTDRFLATVGPKSAAEIQKRHLLGLGEPAQVAHAIAFLLSPEASWITGVDLAVDGGYSVQA